ncbi:MAG: phytoene desaturase family protein, partial [Lachnospiraceae bacterium]
MADNYDAIVIGAGNGGLSAAAALACAGKKTLLLERHNLPGGSATSFVRGRFEFETALHELCDLGDADQPGTVWKIFAGYGINQVDWQREDRLFRLLVPGEIDLVLPTGEEAFCDAMEQAVPGCRPAVAALLALGKKATQAQAVVMGQHPGPEELMAQYSDFLKMASSTTREGMDALGMPERAANILETYWCYLGGDADQLDFLTTAEMIWKYVALQPAQPDQKSHGLSLAMAKVIYDHGGEIWLNTAADEILVENGKVTGVRCGKRILHTKHVVADCSPSTVIGALLPKDAPVPARPRRLLNARRYAKCLATMYVGLNRSAEELGIRDYSTLIMSDLDTSLQAKKANTREKGVFIANCLNVMIPESSPSGTCTLFFTS